MTPVLKSLNPYRQKLNLFVAVFLFSLLVSIFIGYILTNNDSYSEQLISEIYSDVETDLQLFLSSVEGSLLQIKKDYQYQKYSFNSIDDLNRYFSAKLDSSFGISSIYIGSSLGNQFLLYRDKSTWISGTRVKTENENQLKWQRIDDDNNVLSEWVEVIDYDPRLEAWYNNSDIAFNDSVAWTPTHQFFSTKQFGTSALVTWKDNNLGDTIFCSANVSFKNLSDAVSKLTKYSNRKLYLLLFDKYYVDVPEKGDSVFSNYNALSKKTEISKDSTIEVILSEWSKLNKKVDVPFSFSFNENLWWNRIEKLKLNSEMKAGLSITESALHRGDSYYTYLIYLLIIIVLGIQIAFIFIFWKKRNEYQTVLNEAQVWKDYSHDEVESLIQQGENNYVEFKSSLRWDYQNDKVNKHLEEVILKSVAAFNNGKGGTLIIGVDDDINVLGIEKDCQSLKRKDRDYFEIHIRNLFNQTFGINYTTTNLKISFPKFNNRTICIIEIMKGNKPLFIELTDNKGRKSENFFIRSGNTSQKVESLVEISNYISKRFAEKSES